MTTTPVPFPLGSVADNPVLTSVAVPFSAITGVSHAMTTVLGVNSTSNVLIREGIHAGLIPLDVLTSPAPSLLSSF